MIRVPGEAASASRGKTARALVELVDMYKTLADLFALHTETGVEGRSFAPLLSNPEMTHSVRALNSRQCIIILCKVAPTESHVRDDCAC